MALQVIEGNAVVVARQFNPTVTSQHWLVKTGLLADGDPGKDFVFTPLFSHFTNDEFDFLLVPERLQIAPLVEADKQQGLLIDRVGKLIKAVPHTPFVAVGLNFTVQIVPEHVDVIALTRRCFFVSGSPLHEEFDAPDARFGGYFSRDVLGMRLKLDVKPARGIRPGWEDERHFVNMDFNYQYDIKPEEDPVAQIVDCLSKWNEARSQVLRIADILTERDRP